MGKVEGSSRAMLATARPSCLFSAVSTSVTLHSVPYTGALWVRGDTHVPSRFNQITSIPVCISNFIFIPDLV